MTTIWFLVSSLCGTIFLQLFFFLIAYRCQFDKLTDFAGSLNFFLIALLSLIIQAEFFTRQIVVSALVLIWSIRLGGFLLLRVCVRGSDSRFDDMRAQFWSFLGFWVFQMVWVWTVSLPVIFLNSFHVNVELSSADYIAWAIWGVGFVVEVWADFAKYRFNADSANRGRLLRFGIWKYSRHPNYFGEILCWIGIFVSCSMTFDVNDCNWAWLSICSPIITFVLLVFASGIPLAEDRYDQKFGLDPSYVEYKNQTSPLIPLPTSFYASLSSILKKIFFCEYDRYSRILNEMQNENI